ncbi:hypothetical protein A3K73_03125 [Candidatus Pacearchaeota archaeon RBG_13_36_9]|nr:MAG: hypothetical protein A3K73_03125 [Candidatus Pacearchaeota archaeon RBG_13_36_9]HJX50953.1 hypothetical protein [Candidatus Nanoarchaeia archaeon]
MEKKSVAIVFLLLIVILPNVKGDAVFIPRDYTLNNYVVNPSDFKDAYIFYYYPRNSSSYAVDIMQSDSYLCRSYLNSDPVGIGAVRASFYAQTGKAKIGEMIYNYKYPDPKLSVQEQASLDDLFYNEIILSGASFKCGSFATSDDNLLSVSGYYTILGFSDKELLIYLSSNTTLYRNGSSKTENFEPPIIKNVSLSFPGNHQNQPIVVPPNQTTPPITPPNVTPNITSPITPPIVTPPQVEVPFTTKFFCFIKRLFGIKC